MNLRDADLIIGERPCLYCGLPTTANGAYVGGWSSEGGRLTVVHHYPDKCLRALVDRVVALESAVEAIEGDRP